jgi:epoxyqueuosine reductase
VYGCDVCQEVCPWNVSFATTLSEPAFRPREMFLDAGSRDGTRALAREILMMDSADYAAAFKGSAIKRAKLWMLKRNACVVLGNIGTIEDLTVLEEMLLHEREVVREQAAWATSQLQTSRASEAARLGLLATKSTARR